MGIVGITVTGIVYHVAIRAFLELDSWALVADHLLHTVVPVFAIVGWVLYGPRRFTSPRVAKRTVLFPLVWFAFTLTRGAVNAITSPRGCSSPRARPCLRDIFTVPGRPLREVDAPALHVQPGATVLQRPAVSSEVRVQPEGYEQPLVAPQLGQA